MNSIVYNRAIRVRFAIIITLLWGIVLLLSPFKVMADDITANPTLTLSYGVGEGANIESYVKDVNTYTQNIAEFDLMSFDGGDALDGIATGTLTLNFTVYTKLNQDKKTKVMNYALDSIKDSGISTVSSNKIYNFIQSQDVSTASLVRQLSNDVDADFADAYMFFKPFSGFVGFILGLFAIAIFTALTLMIIVDISYIVIPLIRDWLTPSDTNGKPKFVSNEAWYAVKEVDSASNKHKNVLFIYFKKKSTQFAILSICLLYLLSGEIYILIGNLMDMFRGILD